jgi:hypothetical protein
MAIYCGGPFSICVIHKEGLCPSSGDINRLMMMIWPYYAYALTRYKQPDSRTRAYSELHGNMEQYLAVRAYTRLLAQQRIHEFRLYAPTCASKNKFIKRSSETASRSNNRKRVDNAIPLARKYVWMYEHSSEMLWTCRNTGRIRKKANDYRARRTVPEAESL